MAYYAALVSLVQLLKDITKHDHPAYSNIHKKYLQFSDLYEKFNLLQELLEDYSSKDLAEESADTLESRIRNASYCAQDFLESNITNNLELQTRFEPYRDTYLLLGVSIFNFFRLAFDYTMEHVSARAGLKKVKEEVDSIVQELMRIKESHTTHEEDLQLGSSYISAEAWSGRNTMVVVDEGFMTKIKGQLCGESSNLEVISIVGMGGLGKSTLARNIFDDKLIYDRFDCRAWVTVSQDYHRRNILLAIVTSLNIIMMELHGVGEETLEEAIYKHLFGRRYLIIMDDMWDTKVWNDIRRIFPNKSDGSRLMITTRLHDVAVYVGNSRFLHQMKFLDDEQSWTLLRKKVFMQEHCPKELEVIGKLIAKSCKGLPLAIVVIAGVLSNVNMTRHDWEEIARNVRSTTIDQNDEHLSKLLSLSYSHLPHHLKPCFLYLGGFPEDHEISISRLIKLWVAEGFLKPSESRSFEEVGEECVKDLVKRNLVLITKKSFNGKFKRCSIHDLLRDLCLQRAHYEKFLHCLYEEDDHVDRESVANMRRLYIQTRAEDSLFRKYIIEHVSQVRSIIAFAEFWNDIHFSSVAKRCKMSRILDTAGKFDSPVSSAIFELLHLRYLTFQASVFSIPPSISKLQNLQTLIVDNSHVSLPSEIWKMPRLRHIVSPRGVTLTLAPIPIDFPEIRMIDRAPLLGSLQTLHRLIDHLFLRDTIQMIPSLKKLKVKYYPYRMYKNWEELGLNNLFHLHQLESLEIVFREISSIAPPLPKNFDFPGTLIKLSLSGSKLPWKDMRVVGKLPNLQQLKLQKNAFVGQEWQPVEKFIKLKFLLMERLSDLKYWRAEDTHFPILEQLHIKRCNQLEEIPCGIGDISTLELIELEDCNLDVVSSALKIQEEKRDEGNDDLRVYAHRF